MAFHAMHDVDIMDWTSNIPNLNPIGQWRGALMFSLICPWMNDWVNNRDAGDLRRRRTHYDVTVMWDPRDSDPKCAAIYKVHVSAPPATGRRYICHKLISPGQNGRQFADDIFRCNFVNEKFCILIKISLKFVPEGPIDKSPALV